MYSRPDEVSILSDKDNELFNTQDLPPIVLGNESINFNSTSTSAIQWNMNKIYVFADDGAILTKEQLSQVNWEKPKERKKTNPNGKAKTEATRGTLNDRKIIPLDFYRNSHPTFNNYIFADDGSKLTKEEFEQVNWIKKIKDKFHKGKLGEREVILVTKPRLRTNQYVFADDFDTFLTQAEIERVAWLDSSKKMGKLDNREIIISRKGNDDYRIVFAISGDFITPAEYARILWNNSTRTSGKLDTHDVITRQRYIKRHKIVFNSDGTKLDEALYDQIIWDNDLHNTGKFNDKDVITHELYVKRKNKIVYLDTGRLIPKDQKLKVKWDDKEQTRGQLDGRIIIPKEIYLRDHPKTKYVFVNEPWVYVRSSELLRVIWQDKQKTMGSFRGREIIICNDSIDIQADPQVSRYDCTPHPETQTSDEQSFDVETFTQSLESSQLDVDTATQTFLNSGGVLGPDLFVDSNGESFQYAVDKENFDKCISGPEIKISNEIDLQADQQASRYYCVPHFETQTSDKQSFDVEAFSQSIESTQFDVDTATQIFLNPGEVVVSNFFVDSRDESFQYAADEDSVEAGISTEAGDLMKLQAGVMSQVSPAQAIAPPFGFFASQQSYLQKRRLSEISNAQSDTLFQLSEGEDVDNVSEIMLWRNF